MTCDEGCQVDVNLVNLKYSDSERRSGARQRAPFSSPLGCRRHSGVRAAPTRRRMPRTLGRVVACSGGRGEIIAAAHNALSRVQPVKYAAHLEERARTAARGRASASAPHRWRAAGERRACPGAARAAAVPRPLPAAASGPPAHCHRCARSLQHQAPRSTSSRSVDLGLKAPAVPLRGVRPERSRPLAWIPLPGGDTFGWRRTLRAVSAGPASR
jgi:hypothetical protein